MYRKLIIIPVFLFLNACSNSNQKYTTTTKVPIANSEDIINFLNKDYTQTTVKQETDGYTYLSLDNSKNLYSQLLPIIKTHVTPKYTKCFLLDNFNQIGPHVTLFEPLVTYKDNQNYYKNLINRKVNIKYSQVYILVQNRHLSHNKRIIYAASVSMESKDYTVFTDNGKNERGIPLHLTLAMFEQDQDNECIQKR